MPDQFAPSIATCLTYPDPPSAEQIRMVEDVLADRQSQAPPDRAQLLDLQARIDAAFPSGDRVALVYGGATKIKGYVFEAPKLPEIRGASALLDWVNTTALAQLWHSQLGEQLGEQCIVYKSGGNILAFAPSNLGQTLADQIEQTYTKYTLTANSAAVAADFSLLELCYGRMPNQGELFWVEEFENAWENPQLQPQLAAYYYGAGTEPARNRFFRRKAFGECVTLLTTMFNRRRSERTLKDRHERVVSSYPLLPWSVKCDSSGIRPAVWQTQVGDETTPRQMSQASALKRYAGQIVKNAEKEIKNWPREWLSEEAERQLRADSWEQRWHNYLADQGKGSQYAAHAEHTRARAAKDVGEIGAASNGYIGMIYADGNNVGRLIASLKTPTTYHQVSALLADAATDAVFAALAEYLEPVRISSVKNNRQIEEYVHPFEILAIGGDDLLLIVPGKRAFDISLKIALLFERALASQLPEITKDARLVPQDRTARYSGDDQHGFTQYLPVIGLSAGVVIAQESAPMFFLRTLVDELLKNAKKLAKDRKLATGDLGGAIDFMVMKSITMVTDKIGPFRAAALGDHSHQKVRTQPMRRLTARPYTWNEFGGLLAAIREFQNAKLPRSQLYRLRGVLQEAIESGITASVMEYLYTRTRLRQGGDVMQKQIEHLWRASGAESGRLTIGPWLPYTRYDQSETSQDNLDDRETIWGDLLEAYEMVQ